MNLKLTHLANIAIPRKHACKTSAHAQGLYFRNGSCEGELHNKNAFFELKSYFISIQNFKAGNIKPPGMHCYLEQGFLESSRRLCKKATHLDKFCASSFSVFMFDFRMKRKRAWTFKHDFRLWCKEESMWCKREKLEQLINFVFVKF